MKPISHPPVTVPLAVFEALEVAVVIVDADQQVMLANNSFRSYLAAMTGLSTPVPPGVTWTELFDALTPYIVNPQRARACWERAAADGELRVSVVELRDGSRMRQTVKPIDLPGGRGLLGEFVDLGLQAQILQDSDNEYRKIFEEGPLGITIVDAADLSYLRVNPRMAEILGYSVEELLALNFQKITHPEDLDLDLGLSKRLLGGELPFYQIDKRLMHAQGHPVWCRLTATLIRDANGRPLYGLGLLEDINERKRGDQQRQQLEAQLVHSQKLESIGTLAAGVAHEINNPIQGVLSYAELIGDHDEASAEVRDFAEEIIVECGHMSSIVRNLLSFSRREPAPHAPVELAELVSGALSLIRAVLRHDQIEIEVDVPPYLPPAMCSEQQIRQVILNLVTNARDALNERFEGPHPNKRIELHARALPDSHELELTVLDHGAGMDAELTRRVFDPFFTTKGSERGTGLGLSVTHNIVKEHGGEIRVHSKPGQGTSFVLRLPAAGPR